MIKKAKDRFALAREATDRFIEAVKAREAAEDALDNCCMEVVDAERDLERAKNAVLRVEEDNS